MRAEYRFTDFGRFTDKSNVAFFPSTNINHHYIESQAEAGVSFKFDTYGPGPMAAR